MRIGTIIPVEEVISKVIDTKDDFILINNTQIKKTDTLRAFAVHGTKCSACGEEAAYFLYFEDKYHQYLRLIVYRNTPSGRPAFLTKDHIIPKSKGGPNTMDNYQIMCVDCNLRKGTDIDVKRVPPSLYPYLPQKLVKQVSRNYLSDPIDKLEIAIYKDYIKWYTMKFHKRATYHNWITSVRPIAQTRIHAIMGTEFKVKAFTLAYDQLISEQVSIRKDNPSTPILRPARFFKKYP